MIRSRTVATDADSHTWTYATTPTSSTSTTPLGEATTSASTTYGLPGSTTFPGGASTSSAQNGTTSLDESYRFPASRTDESGRTRSFVYDAISALTSATDLGGHAWGYAYSDVVAGDVSFDVESGYQYDDDGNRTLRTTSAGTETYTYDSGSELRDITVGAATIAHYDYDAAGRVTHRTRGIVEQQLTYDADDHLVRVQDPAGTNVTLWDFDAAGRRVRRADRSAGVTVAAHRYEIAPTLTESLESPHAVTDDTGHAQTEYVFAGEHPLFRYDAVTGAVVYYLQDSMGSTIGLADTTAASPSTIQYDGFGNQRVTTGSLTALSSSAEGDFRFQGMWLDAGTGLYYVRARTYEAESGRFTSRDRFTPMRTEASPGPYRFAADSPSDVRDPSGLIDFNLGSVATAISAGLSIAFRAIALTTFIRAVQNCIDSGFAPECGWDVGLSTVTLGLTFSPGRVVRQPAITFSEQGGVGHGARHLVGTGLSRVTVERAIEADIRASLAANGPAYPGYGFWGQVVVDGETIVYRAFQRADVFAVNVSTYYLL